MVPFKSHVQFMGSAKLHTKEILQSLFAWIVYKTITENYLFCVNLQIAHKVSKQQ